MRLAGEVALITGGGSGIGQGIAQRFAAEGAVVIVADKAGDRASTTAKSIHSEGGEAVALTLDVTVEDDVVVAFGRVAREVGPVSILVNNAGLSVGTDVARITSAEWDRNFDVVIRATFLCSRAVLPMMMDAKRGVILNIASVNGMFGIGEDAYSAAKAGLLNLTQNLAIRHGKHGIRVNAISPGTIRTPIWNERLALDPGVFDNLNAWYPLGRIGEVDDVAAAALFLCSAEAGWITGVNLPVDGGLTAGSVRMVDDLGGS
ncbi:MAG: glucose 1-dehydrogenase [Chloroflexota bacterium]|nr:glucose 1-dehydrogenase [Chloroflexota bacterium]